MQEIPSDKLVDGFDILELNTFIRSHKEPVFLFWIKLLKVDISELSIV
jgi:hypothetical protein